MGNMVEDYLALQFQQRAGRLSLDRMLSGEMSPVDWQQAVVSELRSRLGSGPAVFPPLETQELGSQEFPGVRMRRISYVSEEGLCTPAYYLLPTADTQPVASSLPAESLPAESLPAIVAIAGHGYGNRDIVGLLPDGQPRGNADPGYEKDFALALCRRGFVVIVPEMLGFGDLRLQEDLAGGPAASSCHRITTYLSMIGRTTAGVRVQQAMRAVEVLAALGDTDMDRIGIMGISGGGLVSAFAAVLEPRFQACVVSGYANTFRDSIMAIHHCVDNFAMGLATDVELPDLLAAISPRPMLWEAGTRDPIFPYAATQMAYAQVKQVYDLLGVPDNLQLDAFEGEHQISGAKAYDFLWEALKVS